MVHVSDIEQDIARGDLRGIEAAFRALVGYPGEETIEGADSVDQLLNLLRRVAIALGKDSSILPGTTMEMLKDVMRTQPISRSTYAEGGRIALENLNHWEAIFARHQGSVRPSSPRRGR